MVDFSLLLAKSEERAKLSPQERKDLDARERFASDAHHVVRDERMRDEHSLELRVVTLGTHADMRNVRMKDAAGEYRAENVMMFAYRDDGRPIDGSGGMKQILHIPSEADRLTEERGGEDRLDAIHRKADQGVVISVLGRDVQRSWKRSDDTWAKTTEFHAQRIGLGEMTREQLMARAPGGLAEASERFVSAEDDRSREAVARAYLRQEPFAEAGAAVRGITRGPNGGAEQDASIAHAARDGNGR